MSSSMQRSGLWVASSRHMRLLPLSGSANSFSNAYRSPLSVHGERSRCLTCASTAVTPYYCAQRFFGESRDPTKPLEKQAAPAVTKKEVVQLIVKNLWPEGRWDLRVRVLTAFTFVFLTKVLKVAVPFWFKSVIDTLVPATAASHAAVTFGPLSIGIFGMVMAYGITRTLATLTDETKRVLFTPVNNYATNTLGLRIFRKLHSMDLSYHLQRQTGSLAKDLDRGSSAFAAVTFDVFFALAPTAIEMILVCYVLQTHAGFSFVSTAFIAVASYFIYTAKVTQWRQKFRARYNEADSKLGGIIIDSLINYETVKYFGAVEFEAKRVQEQNVKMNRAMIDIESSLTVLNFGQSMIFITAATVGLYLGSAAVLAGTMTVGDVVLVDALLMQLYQPLQFLGMVYRELTSSTQNMEKMLGLLKSDIAIKDSSAAAPLVFKKGDIEFQNVTFGYSHDRLIVKDLSLKIPGGTTAAFVGPSGSGKTTIFRLLFRFFDPMEGKVLIDGQDVKNVSLDSLRKEIGVIPQDTVMFNETIRYNIEYGKFGATTEEIEQAAIASSFHNSIEKFPLKYDTLVGERGLMLSGGEKQRLAIARVILKGSPILLADEATSALDSKTEQTVMQTLNQVDQNGRPRTLIMIAHRLSTIQTADQIFVLDGKGGLAEKGTHDELLARRGLYYQLWMRQKREEAEAQDIAPPELQNLKAPGGSK
jgi:ABC-type transport system involved in Fe-S cluster assembly fused permease/ATPase subunit